MRYGHADPNREPCGRQPIGARITPSRIDPWQGTIKGGVPGRLAIEGGERFTVEQQYEIARRGLSADSVEVVTAKRQATGNEISCPEGQLPAVFAFDCPVLGRHRNGRLRVISPSGVEKLIREDGWTHWPKTKPRKIWW